VDELRDAFGQRLLRALGDRAATAIAASAGFDSGTSFRGDDRNRTGADGFAARRIQVI
jgi:hypothetical protein